MSRLMLRPTFAKTRVVGSASIARERLMGAIHHDRRACRLGVCAPVRRAVENAQPDLLELLLAQDVKSAGGRA